MNRWPWDALGIARTEDERVIRRAYAVRLKAIDPDADPAGFIALRQALEAAQAEARYGSEPWIDIDDDTPDIDDDTSLVEHAPLPPSKDGVSRHDMPPPVSDAWRIEITLIERLIFGDPRSAISHDLTEHMWRLVDDPAMGVFDHLVDVEQWAIRTTLAAGPRADPVLLIAAERFDWPARAARWDCPPGILTAMARWYDIGYLQSIEAGRSQDAGADRLALDWLRNPGGLPRNGPVVPVENLLARIRQEHPTLIADLSPRAVEQWDAYLAKRASRPHRRLSRWLRSLSPRAWLRRRPIWFQRVAGLVIAMVSIVVFCSIVVLLIANLGENLMHLLIPALVGLSLMNSARRKR